MELKCGQTNLKLRRGRPQRRRVEGLGRRCVVRVQEHIRGRCAIGYVPAEGLREGCGAVEHIIHGLDAAHIPGRDITIEG